MKTHTLLSRTDQVGVGPFDSIAWALETHVKQPDDGKYNFAVLYGNEDYPALIEFHCNPVPNHTDKPDFVWTCNPTPALSGPERKYE